MRTLLVVNSFATTTTAEVQSVIASALENHLEISVIETNARGHAIEIGKSAVQENYDLVISLGGDGTLNELANGMLASSDYRPLPKLAGLPGGNANVFVRNLGYSNDPVTATAQLIEKIQTGARRTLGVGRVEYESDDHKDQSAEYRWFLFNSGFGLDARVLSKMEIMRTRGRSASDLSYALIALKELFTEVRNGRAQITVEDQFGKMFENLQFALIINFSPWTYVGKFPISPTSKQIDGTSLDLFASYELSVSRTAQLIRDLVLRNNLLKNENVLVLDDQKFVIIKSQTPTWLQTDGEALAAVTQVKIQHFADRLTVIA